MQTDMQTDPDRQFNKVDEIKANAVARRKEAVARRATHPRLVSDNPMHAMDVEYTDADLEFMAAIDRYKRETGVQFPTLREVLRVALSLGYRKP